MAAYFFDSSALVKRYVDETGSAWVNGIILASAARNHRILLARIAGVEVVSAISRRRNAGSITVADASLSIIQFRHEFASLFRIVAIGPTLIDRAMDLSDSYGLRGYDAVQLAAALTGDAWRRRRGLLSLTLISADASLHAAATAEGLAVDDPCNHP